MVSCATRANGTTSEIHAAGRVVTVVATDFVAAGQAVAGRAPVPKDFNLTLTMSATYAQVVSMALSAFPVVEPMRHNLYHAMRMGRASMDSVEMDAACAFLVLLARCVNTDAHENGPATLPNNLESTHPSVARMVSVQARVSACATPIGRRQLPLEGVLDALLGSSVPHVISAAQIVIKVCATN